jgi:hypothetical protein
MNDILALLLRIDLVAVALFLSAVAVLLFVGGICSMFMSKSPVVFIPLDQSPQIPQDDLKFDLPKRRKNDRADC